MNDIGSTHTSLFQPTDEGGQKPDDIATMVSAMLVDNVDRSRRQTAEMLRRLGYNVRPIDTAADAMFEFHRSPCDYFLTAYDVPEINGYQMGRWIKRHRPDTRVVVISRLCRAAMGPRIRDPDIDAWLFTPFGMAELQTALTDEGRPPPPGSDNEREDGSARPINP